MNIQSLSSRNVLCVLTMFLLLISFKASSLPFGGPESDLDGSFKVFWDFSDSWLSCTDLSINVNSKNGYNSQRPINDKEAAKKYMEYSFFNLDPGSYTIELNGKCVLDKEGYDKTEFQGQLGVIEVKVGEDIFSSKMQNSLSSSAGCRASCGAGEHSTFLGCFANCADFNLCSINGGSNYFECQKTEGLTYSTCDRFCDSDYSQTGLRDDTSYSCTRIPSEITNRITECSLRKPSQPDITSATTVASRTYTLAWSNSNREKYYEVRKDSGSWVNVGTARSRTYTNLADGVHNFYVRACNDAGCSSTESQSVNVVIIPSITSILPMTVVGNTVTVYSSPRPVTPYIYRANVADYHRARISWQKISGFNIRFEYHVDGQSSETADWVYYETFNGLSNSQSLCITGVRLNSSDYCTKMPKRYKGDIYYRFRLEKSGVVGPWNYLRPINFYYDS